VSKIKIAFLILAHTDPIHIARLANKLTMFSDFYVFIHVDKKQDIKVFEDELSENKKFVFLKNRYKVDWGSYNSVKATLELLRIAKDTDRFERFVLLQGLDYPIKNNYEIHEYFSKNKSIEFIRSCKISNSKEKYHSKKVELFWFFENRNVFKKIINRLNLIIPVKLRKGYIFENNKKHNIYWGAAQWALTDNAVNFILEFSKTHPKFNKYFKYVFPQDETYFHSIIYNSDFKRKTLMRKDEDPKKFLENWRNLHYFEYPNDKGIKILEFDDYTKILKSNALFIRKVNSSTSEKLLNQIDLKHRKQGF